MRKFKLTEDWTSTVLGIFIVFLVLGLVSFSVIPKWPSFSWGSADKSLAGVFAFDNLGHTVIVFCFSLIIAMLADLLMGRSVKNSLRSYPVVFVLTLVGMLLGGNMFMKEWGLETVIFCLVLGLFISNVFGIPKWLKESLSSEMFVKIGLVILGTNVIFGDLLKAGSLGLIQSVVVVFSVWYFAFWVCKKLKVDKEMSMMLSSAVSICGVSAAVATAGAIRGDKAKLSYVVSLVLFVAVPMIIIMPYLAKWLGLSAPVAGAWVGGTIDTTGAVVATGSIAGEEALKYATIVKFSQNVLLGIAAFIISVYWTYTNKEVAAEDKPSAKVIWQRFPKFVLGFIFTSLLFSFFISGDLVSGAQPLLKKIQGLWFALAFTSIGLETNLKSLFNNQNGKATKAFLIAQGFNIVLTLVVAWFLFDVVMGWLS